MRDVSLDSSAEASSSVPIVAAKKATPKGGLDCKLGCGDFAIPRLRRMLENPVDSLADSISVTFGELPAAARPRVVCQPLDFGDELPAVGILSAMTLWWT